MADERSDVVAHPSAEPSSATDDSPLDAGDFGAWLAHLQGALDGEHPSDVPCGTCTACCTSSQFVHIGPEETDALAHIPRALRFPAPGLPRGHVLLGYDERGHCPMLVDGACSIYEHRPRTCRTYDCRVFPAAGIDVAEPDKARIARQVARWRFAHPTEEDDRRHEAVRNAATYLAAHPDVLPGGPPSTSTRRAVLAVEAHGAFMGRPDPSAREVRVALDRRAQTD